MTRRSAALALGLLALTVAGCGEEAERTTSFDFGVTRHVQTFSKEVLDRKILRLPRQGLTFPVVKSELGLPKREFDAGGGENIVLYGGWQLTFIDGRLEKAVGHYERRWNGYGSPLDRKARKLPLGATIEETKARLGQPEAIELIQNVSAREESLFYGPWQLIFANGRLEERLKV
jgi:hypothetical protein